MSTTTALEPALSVRGLSKTFAGKKALDDVSLEIAAGEVHGLLGQNGSGKSTLIKILSGYHAPDPGATLALHGEPVGLPLRPDQPRGLGLAFVHQDLALADDMTVLDNVRLGRYRQGFGWRIHWGAERRAVAELLERFGVEASPDTPVSALPAVERALVAIIRALDQVRARRRGVLVLDEPTAYLPRDAVERLFGAIRQIVAEHFSVLFVSHRLDETKQLTDRITVLRDAKRVATVETGSVSEHAIVELILGRPVERLYPDHASAPQKSTALRVSGARGAHVRGFDLRLHRREVVGITGLAGAGHEELPYLLFGARPAAAGTLEIDDRVLDLGAQSPRRAMAAGIALLPADRPRFGGAEAATVAENVTLPFLRRFFRGGALRLRAERAHVTGLLHDYSVVPPNPRASFGTLSGGNQQKALVAKWFGVAPRVLLLHEPTQGVDVGARHQIFELIDQAATSGAAILIASAEHEDLAHLCDRVLVFRDGEVAAELVGTQLTTEQIVEQCYAPAAGAEGTADDRVHGSLHEEMR